MFGFENKEREKYLFDKVVSWFEEALAMNLVQTRKQMKRIQANKAKIKRWTKNCSLNSVTLCTVWKSSFPDYISPSLPLIYCVCPASKTVFARHKLNIVRVASGCLT